MTPADIARKRRVLVDDYVIRSGSITRSTARPFTRLT
jgi:hypothetical protein